MKSSSLRGKLLTTFGPPLAIVSLYYGFWQMPKESVHQRDLVRLKQLSASLCEPQLKNTKDKLSSFTLQIKEIEQQLLSDRLTTSKLISSRAAFGNTINGLSAPATSFANLVAVLERQGLKVQSSKPNDNPAAKLPESMQPAARVLSQEVGASPGRTELQLVVTGTFLEMQNALKELRESYSNIVLLSVTMDCIEESSDLRTWTIVAALWELPR